MAKAHGWNDLSVRRETKSKDKSAMFFISCKSSQTKILRQFEQDLDNFAVTACVNQEVCALQKHPENAPQISVAGDLVWRQGARVCSAEVCFHGKGCCALEYRVAPILHSARLLRPKYVAHFMDVSDVRTPGTKNFRRVLLCKISEPLYCRKGLPSAQLFTFLYFSERKYHTPPHELWKSSLSRAVID